MTSDFSNKQGKLPSRSGYQKTMHQGPAQPRTSSSVTRGEEVGVHSRSMERGGSINSQHLTIGSSTNESENEVLLVRTRKTAQKTKENDRPADQEESFSLSGALLAHLPSFMASRSSAMSNDSRTHKENRRPSTEEQSPQQMQSDKHRGERIQSAKQNAICMSRESLDGIVNGIDKHHAARQDKLERQVRDLQHHNDNSKDLLGKLQAQNKQLESEKQELEFEKQAIEEKHNTFILKQQEMTFSHMPSSRWAPVEDSKVMEDLDRLKRDMRSWAKKVSANDMDAVLKSLDNRQLAALRNALENVVVFEHGELPQGLSSRKLTALLLSALLAHDIYTTIVRDPFFFLGTVDLGGRFEKTLFRQGLEETCKRGLASDEEDTHVWRSHTLRLFLPPVETGTSEGGKELHAETEYMIGNAAYKQAWIFLHSAAKYLIDDDQLRDKIFPIYREAAMVSYNLWTRRTKLVCYTLHDDTGSRPLFHPNSKDMIAHSSVDYESHADQLEGRAISIILHPCLKVYGTDDGKDYHQGRVWAPAEVWLDSRKPSAE
ncbi:554c94d3-3607-4c4c-8197-ebb64585b157 [Sclerotinia trifoliorum]|uniref:554c94d3-3607-4c4c-8197-ebb64585b157 n=1 Tax=Sclerotinia trifoliorum TaxID=28548 RepID=A0A8H2W2E6_9HELO|nr:554c94d3-3607-4c4c-8197-ebb64585b157 [Sclerotinia trifoliorum]